MMPVWRTPRTHLTAYLPVRRRQSFDGYLTRPFLRVAVRLLREADARVFVFHTQIIEVTALMRRDSGRIARKNQRGHGRLRRWHSHRLVPEGFRGR
jgi:uncharacterized protein with von Willebrand factor type A (vWA) domain